jgi:hypothetical protein
MAVDAARAEQRSLREALDDPALSEEIMDATRRELLATRRPSRGVTRRSSATTTC